MAGRDLQTLTQAAPTGAAFAWDGGVGSCDVVGTFDGGTYEMQQLGLDGTTWTTIIDLASAGPPENFDLGPCQLRQRVTSAGGSTNLLGRVQRSRRG